MTTLEDLMRQIPAPPEVVRKSDHGQFTVSTNVDYRGTYETRFFFYGPGSHQSSNIPTIVKSAIMATSWERLTDESFWIGYDNESVQSVSKSDALTIHDTFVTIITDYLTGTLA